MSLLADAQFPWPEAVEENALGAWQTPNVTEVGWWGSYDVVCIIMRARFWGPRRSPDETF